MLRATSTALQSLGITGPALLVDEARARRNIRRLADKARRDGVILRPHFKTHRSAAVGRWFADEGVAGITVSSAAMAERFARAGWRDITLAFLLNPLEVPRLAALALALRGRGGCLGVAIDSVAAARALAPLAGGEPAVWLKVDTGYGRTGLPWRDPAAGAEVCAALPAGLAPRGLLAHAGHGYRARDRELLRDIWVETRDRLAEFRRGLGRPDLRLSVGDTPTCCAVESFAGVDEVRPGNFVFFDLMQLQIGSCGPDDLAAAAVCPVVGVYPDSHRLVVHGGAVHLSKEHLTAEDGRALYGRLGTLQIAGGLGLGRVLGDTSVTDLSQEHGVIRIPPRDFSALAAGLQPGDLVLIWPVHSCLACDLLPRRVLPQGAPLD